jgi:hypothetical protein
VPICSHPLPAFVHFQIVSAIKAKLINFIFKIASTLGYIKDHKDPSTLEMFKIITSKQNDQMQAKIYIYLYYKSKEN